MDDRLTPDETYGMMEDMGLVIGAGLESYACHGSPLMIAVSYCNALRCIQEQGMDEEDPDSAKFHRRLWLLIRDVMDAMERQPVHDHDLMRLMLKRMIPDTEQDPKFRELFEEFVEHLESHSDEDCGHEPHQT